MSLKKLLRNKKFMLILTASITALTIILALLLSQKTIIKDPKISIFASSEKGKSYIARNAIDGKKKTVWISKSKKGGKSEWIKIIFSQPIKVSGIKIINGYTKQSKRWGDYYEMYNRLRATRIVFSDYLSYYWILKDNKQSFQSFTLPAPRTTTSIKFFIHSIYRGTLKDELAISEIQFW